MPLLAPHRCLYVWLDKGEGANIYLFHGVVLVGVRLNSPWRMAFVFSSHGDGDLLWCR